MKAVLSNRIYLKVTEDLKADLEERLTYTIYRYNMGRQKPIVIKNCITVTKDIVSIPSGREDLIPDGHKIVDKRVFNEVKLPKFSFELRESQQKIYDQVDSSCIINAAPSWGKFLPSCMVTYR